MVGAKYGKFIEISPVTPPKLSFEHKQADRKKWDAPAYSDKNVGITRKTIERYLKK